MYDVPIYRLLSMRRRDIEPPREELIAWCQDLYTEALEWDDGQSRWLQMRDAAQFSVLTELGPRLRSVRLMQVGVHLRHRPDGLGWCVSFGPAETKQNADYAANLEEWTWPIINR